MCWPFADPEGGTGGPDPPPLKNHKNIGFLSNTGQDPLKNHKATVPSQNSMLGHHRHVSKTPFKWRFAGGPMMARFQFYLDPLINKKKSWTHSEKSFWIRPCWPCIIFYLWPYKPTSNCIWLLITVLRIAVYPGISCIISVSADNIFLTALSSSYNFFPTLPV